MTIIETIRADKDLREKYRNDPKFHRFINTFASKESGDNGKWLLLICIGVLLEKCDLAEQVLAAVKPA